MAKLLTCESVGDSKGKISHTLEVCSTLKGEASLVVLRTTEKSVMSSVKRPLTLNTVCMPASQVCSQPSASPMRCVI